jgi:hypothetical protein
MKHTQASPFKRLVLRAVLNDVSPIVARVFSIADDVEITDLHDIFLSMLGWQESTKRSGRQMSVVIKNRDIFGA